MAATVSPEALLAERQTVAADATLADDERTGTLALYDRAVDAARGAVNALAETEAWRERAASAPARAAELRAALDAMHPVAEISPQRYEGQSTDELTTLVDASRSDVQIALESFQQRRAGARALTTLLENPPEATPATDGSAGDLAASALPGGTVRERGEIAGRRALATAEDAARRARLERNQVVLASYERLTELAILELEVAMRELQRLTAEHESLARALAAVRLRAARGASEDAVAAAASVSALPDAIQALASENVVLRAERQRTLRLESNAAIRLRTARARAGFFEGDIQFTRARLNSVGPSPAVGRLIRDQLQGLPSLVELEQVAASRRAERDRTLERRVDLERRLRALLVPRQTIDTVIESIPRAELAALGESRMREEARKLTAVLLQSTEGLYAINGRYLWTLRNLDEIEGRIAAVVQQATTIAREDLLWIRSMRGVSPADLGRLGPALYRLSSGEAWRATIRSAFESARARPGPAFAGLAILLLLVRARPRARRGLARLAEQVRRARTDSFAHTVVASGHTLVLAGALPLSVAALGWLARSEPSSDEFSIAVGEALLVAGRVLLALTLLRWAAAPDGLSYHFHWPEAPREALRRELRWFTPVLVTSLSLVAGADYAGMADVTIALGRPAMFALSIGAGALIWRLLGPRSVLAAYLSSPETASAAGRWWRAWFPLLLAAPVALVASSALGYYDATLQLAGVLVRTGWLIVALILLRDLLLRWFYVVERRERLEAALRRREEARAERERVGEEAEAGDAEAVEVEEPSIDYRALGEQGRAVVGAATAFGLFLGLWALWGDLVPAVGVLERVELPLTRTEILDGIERRIPITLFEIGVALLVLAGALVASKNLSGLLGFTLLRQLRLDPGASYAIVTLGQYTLVAGGVLYAFASLGLDWSKLQWLIAALGVGLGFGLQEIVANFVCGIILLLERPVRVGDTVTVGDADGTVARIRIRATTIITWERKELVVPNKEFITTKVLNWTLSDSETRLLIVVGIAYGSDAKRARELVLEAATETEQVLAEPRPSVTFASFGDNSLNLELRCFISSMDYWLTTQTALHDAIYDKLNAAGITIAFPQRDVHLDVSGPLDVRLRHEIEPGEQAPAAGQASAL